ncbi:PASTA domain-containing protein [Bifidobacterium simiarum]|uniref:PASTA domain-containing protein n=1 Tax=Bifidobacterium simiarum TaxID=2045441 RepID=UPI001FAEC0FA|nr:hypothetical protein [Bifidobacterium simiarum]
MDETGTSETGVTENRTDESGTAGTGTGESDTVESDTVGAGTDESGPSEVTADVDSKHRSESESSDESRSDESLSDTIAAISDPDDQSGTDDQNGTDRSDQSGQSNQPGQSGQPDQPGRSDQPGQSGQPESHTSGKPNRKLAIIIAAIVAAALVIGSGLFATYRAGVWGRKTIPTAQEINEITPRSGKKITAADVAKQLNDRGIDTTITKVYSGKASGTFVGFDGVRYGESIKPTQTVTVTESMGPGVPKGTVGQQAAKVSATLKSMGAKVKYKQVIVTDTSKQKPGTVVATLPSDGSALTDDYDNTIEVGVAVEGDGVGYDLFGMDKNKAGETLSAKGYTVTLKPKFSSRAHLGKIIDADPAFGSTKPADGNVTLYYGVDASQTKTMFTQTLEGHKLVVNKPSFLDGRFCKAADSAADGADSSAGSGSSDGSTGPVLSNDCFVLATSQDDGYLYSVFPESSGHKTLGGLVDTEDSGIDDSVRSDMLTASRDFQALGEAPGMVDDGLLINGKTGAFELFPLASAEGDVYCGDAAVGDSGGVSCVNGQRVFDPTMLSKPTGLTRKMNDFFLYVPVNADLKAVEDSGYFDASALAKAKKQQAVNTDRPFIVMRDKSLYDKSQTEIAYTSNADSNPFLPADPRVPNSSGTSLKMKPAPSNSTVYYLDEDYYALDWDSLADANVAGASGTSESGDSATSGADDDSDDQDDAESTKLFAELAGSQYSYSPSADGSMYSLMTLKSDGTFSGTTYAADLSGGDSVADAPRKQYPFSGRFSSAERKSDGSIELDCDASALKVTDEGESGLKLCDEFIAYPAGTSLDSFDTSVQWALQIRGESTSGPKDWLLVNVSQGAGSGGVYERTQK